MAFQFTSIYFDKPIVKGRVMDIFRPEKATRDVAVFLIHGGGWQVGSRSDFHTLMQAFNNDGYICASTDYRSASDGRNILDQITDIRQAYNEFISYLDKNGKPSNVFVIGSSAGAHLAELIAYTSPGECGERFEYRGSSMADKWVRPVGVCAICAPVSLVPWEDIFPEIRTSIKNALGASYDEAPELYQRLSPDYYLNSCSCPSLFVCAEDEHIFPNRMVKKFVSSLSQRKIKAEYKIYPRVEHGFMYGLDRWQQLEAFLDILNFIESIKG